MATHLGYPQQTMMPPGPGQASAYGHMPQQPMSNTPAGMMPQPQQPQHLYGGGAPGGPYATNTPAMGPQPTGPMMGGGYGGQPAGPMGQPQQQQQQQAQQPMMTAMMATQPNTVDPPDRQRGPIKTPWAVWPCTRQEVSACEVPVGILFTPFTDDQQVQSVSYEPVRSRMGGCVLNPLCTVDFRNKYWTDPFSLQRIALPPQYAQQLTESNLCAELMNSTVEYKLNTPRSQPPTYIFIVDTTIYDEELDALKDSLQQVLGIMPTDATIGLITYGTVVHIHELGFAECVKSYVFRGNKEVTKEEIRSQLKIGQTQRPTPMQTQMGQAAQVNNTRNFLCPLSECEFILNVILDDLQPDSWPVAADSRANRCTGAALSAAVSLMELACHQQPGRILLFTGGVCTSGPGQVVGTPLSESIRQHIDLQKESTNAKYCKKATAFYTDLTTRSVAAGHAIDIFSCALDQTGLYEMKVCSERTGGIVVMSDTFSMNVFRDSLRKLFEAGPDGHLQCAFNVRVEILCSKEVKVCGAIGCCTSTNKKSSQVSELTVGQASTCEWVAGVMDKNSTMAFYLDVANTNEKSLQGRSACIQLQVTFTHPSGERRCRVMSIGFPFAAPRSQNGTAQLGSGFDQETATVMMARLAVSKTEGEEPLDILRWLDRKLIHLVALFADYQKDQPDTFQLGAEFMYYPAFMYHLRRSHFLQTFNASPDETAYYRVVLLRENLSNSITMISPHLFQYSAVNSVPIPVDLDSRALKQDVALLLDSFFHLVVWYGETVVRWKDAGYHEQEGYEGVKRLLEAPLEDAKRTLQNRLPCPKFVVCNAGGSQARFLLAKVNPSSTHQNLLQEYGESADGASIITDDVSLKVFMDHLIKLATST